MQSINKVLKTVSKLRDPVEGCPWDIEQSHQSITSCLIDECCELLQTIDRLDMEHMKEELGDVLLQVVFHSQIASEAKDFSFDEVCECLNEKLINRHPHVFGDDERLKNSEEVLDKWEDIKSKEPNRGKIKGSKFKDLPKQLPSIMFAQAVHKQIKRKKIDASKFYDSLIMHPSLKEELIKPDLVGKFLYNFVTECKDNGIDAESSLRKYTQKIIDS